MTKELSFKEVLNTMVGRTVQEIIMIDEDEENYFIMRFTDGYSVQVGLDHDDVDLYAIEGKVGKVIKRTKVSYVELAAKIAELGWADDFEVSPMEELEGILDEASPVLRAYGFVFGGDYVIAPVIQKCIELDGIFEELFGTRVDLDHLPKGIDQLSEGAQKYWKDWMQDEGDDTYYDYHLSFPAVIVSAVIEIITEKDS